MIHFAALNCSKTVNFENHATFSTPLEGTKQ